MANHFHFTYPFTKVSSFLSPFYSHTVGFIITKRCYVFQVFHFALPPNFNGLLCHLSPTGLLLLSPFHQDYQSSPLPRIPFPQAWNASHTPLNSLGKPHYSSVIISTDISSVLDKNLQQTPSQIGQCPQPNPKFFSSCSSHCIPGIPGCYSMVSG